MFLPQNLNIFFLDFLQLKKSYFQTMINQLKKIVNYWMNTISDRKSLFIKVSESWKDRSELNTTNEKKITNRQKKKSPKMDANINRAIFLTCIPNIIY